MERFGKYSVVARLGVGGMAELYKCRLTGPGGFDKFVAVKRVLPERAEEPEYINMLLDEARLAAHLTHPNIVQIFEIDEEEGVAYIAMEYLRGPTFRALVREAWKQNNLPFGHVAKIMAEVCSGLDYAHHATNGEGEPLRLVHRDVTPQNIIVGLNGSPKLLDFGVAKAEGRLAATDAGTIKGKLKYMAPEQLRGEPIDARADVFSAGICLYEATTGSLPFAPGNTSDLDLLQAVLRGAYKKPSERVPGFPRVLEDAILWAIEPELDKRCPSAAALHEALEAFVSSGEYASSTAKVGVWVKQLFPVGEDNRTETRSVIKTPSPAHFRSTRSVSVPPSPPRPPAIETVDDAEIQMITGDGPPPRKKLPVFLAAAAVAAALVAGGAYLYLSRTGTHPAPGVTTSVPRTATPSPVEDTTAATPQTGDQAALAYIEEAERYAKQHRYAVALELLAKTKDLKISSASINIRVSTLIDELELQSMLFRARKLIDAGQGAQAVEVVKQALERAPDSPEALELLVKARKLTSGAGVHAAPAVVTRGHLNVPAGMLSVTSQPSGGLVYLDDESVGRTPLLLRSVHSGVRHVQVRLRGYAPVERDLNIRVGKTTVVAMTLGNDGARPAPASEPEASEPSSAEAAPEPRPSAPVASLGNPPVEAAPTSRPTPAPPAPTPATAPSTAVPVPTPTPTAPAAASAARGTVTAPHLPRVYVSGNEQDLRRVMAAIESEAASTGRVGFARGATHLLTDEILSSSNDGAGAQIYPVAIYYFLVREAALGRNREQAASELRAVQQNQNLLRLRDLPHTDTKL